MWLCARYQPFHYVRLLGGWQEVVTQHQGATFSSPADSLTYISTDCMGTPFSVTDGATITHFVPTRMRHNRRTDRPRCHSGNNARMILHVDGIISQKKSFLRHPHPRPPNRDKLCLIDAAAAASAVGCAGWLDDWNAITHLNGYLACLGASQRAAATEAVGRWWWKLKIGGGVGVWIFPMYLLLLAELGCTVRWSWCLFSYGAAVAARTINLMLERILFISHPGVASSVVNMFVLDGAAVVMCLACCFCLMMVPQRDQQRQSPALLGCVVRSKTWYNVSTLYKHSLGYNNGAEMSYGYMPSWCRSIRICRKVCLCLIRTVKGAKGWALHHK